MADNIEKKSFLDKDGAAYLVGKIKTNLIDTHTSRTDNPHSVTKTQIGLENVENKSSETIRSELTKENVTTALGYTPAESTGDVEWDNIKNKPDTFTPSEHTHTASDITDLNIPTQLSDLAEDENHRLVTDTEKSAWNSKSDFSGDYGDLNNIPESFTPSAHTHTVSEITDIDIPDSLSDLSDDATHRLVTDTEKATWNAKSDFSGSYNDLSDKPSIPDSLDDLSDDATHRLVTDTQIVSWNAKSTFSGSYNDLTDKPSIPTQASDIGAVDTSLVGASNGLAQLDSDGKVPSSQLPSYVDDVLEYVSKEGFPETGETGKIYVALNTNLTYRWSGSAYVEISPSIALGETSSTAYAGDKGKKVTDDLVSHKEDTTSHITSTERSTWNGKQDALTQGANITIENGVISATDTTYSTATTSNDGLMSSADKTKLDSIRRVVISDTEPTINVNEEWLVEYTPTVNVE